jgi:catechol 2,3-dioxygenase-like lactoylglutathione lyase family enzyme
MTVLSKTLTVRSRTVTDMAPRFDMIGIVATDLATSLSFYRDLGLDVPQPGDQPHVEVTLPGGARLAWDTTDVVRSMDPHWEPASGGARMALAFLCDDPAEVDAVYARMVAAGHLGHLDPWDAPWGQRYAVLHDPDGNPVDLFAPLA